MSIPQSTIYVCSGVRLNSRYEHSIYFADPTAQLNYFAGKVVKTFSAYSFIRKSWDLNVAATMEDAASWSYLYFTNSANAKHYFYFIENIEYVNDGTVRLKLRLDVLQTYLFDFDLLECFVERQHTETDAIGDHTVDEGLEVGTYRTESVQDWSIFKDLCILVLSSFNPNHSDTTKPVPALAGMYDGVFSGLKVWAIDSANWAAWGAKLDDLSEAGFIDGIISMWMYPKALVALGGENTWGDDDLCKTVDSCGSVTNYKEITRPTGFNGYPNVKNKKLLCYPYNFIYATNNCGGSAVFHYERFIGGNAEFACVGSLSPDATTKMFPVNYNGVTDYEEGLTLSNFPACAWDADVYKMWLAQNQNQHALTTGTAGVQIAGGLIAGAASLFTGNLLGAGGGAMTAIAGVHQISSLMAQKADAAIQPPQSRGAFSSNVNVVAGKHCFSFYRKMLTADRARMIDDYFTMYGYKINRVVVPNIHARKSHTYVKTIGCHIDGDFCNEDATAIEAIFDHGVTFWTDGDRIGRYSDDNSTL